MHVLQVFNRRRDWGGEDKSVNDTVEILNANGVNTSLWVRDIEDAGSNVVGKIGLFFSGIYSLQSARKMESLFKEKRPDVVVAHNIYPQLSPSVFRACRRNNVPVIWYPHDQRPICPTGLHLDRGEICERCCGGREYGLPGTSKRF